VADLVGITERAVQRIVNELSEAGYLRVTKEGRRNIYEVHLELPLRHPIEAHRSVGELLGLLKTDGEA
jgi:DNA-binding transcriptional regulator PaaX